MKAHEAAKGTVYVPVMGAGYIRPQTIFHSFVPFKTWCGLYARAGYIRENTVCTFMLMVLHRYYQNVSICVYAFVCLCQCVPVCAHKEWYVCVRLNLKM